MDVLEGEVELVDDRTKESRFFSGGEGASISVKKDGFAKRTHKKGEFSLAESSASDTGVTKFVSISTADPGGRDATVIRGDFDFHHDPSLVMIKNTNDQFSRKGYLGFDCSTLNLEDAKSVELIMNFVYSAMRFLSFQNILLILLVVFCRSTYPFDETYRYCLGFL